MAQASNGIQLVVEGPIFPHDYGKSRRLDTDGYWWKKSMPVLSYAKLWQTVAMLKVLQSLAS